MTLLRGVDREQIYAALFVTLQTALTGIPTPPVYMSRKAVHFTVAAQNLWFPSVFVLEKSETTVRKTGLPYKLTMECELLIYSAPTSNDSPPPSTAINNILTTVDRTLSGPPPMDVQNLGLPGVVEWCRIEGKTEIYEALLDGIQSSVCVVPIRILATEQTY